MNAPTFDTDAALADIQAAMRESWPSPRLCIVNAFGRDGSREGIQVEHRVGNRWVKVGPMLFPPDGGTLADTLAMLASMRTGGDE